MSLTDAGILLLVTRVWDAVSDYAEERFHTASTVPTHNFYFTMTFLTEPSLMRTMLRPLCCLPTAWPPME